MRITLDIDIEQEQAQVTQTWPMAPYVTEPMRDDQRRALFAMFEHTYGTRQTGARMAFANAVLHPDQFTFTTSWKSLSAEDAHKMLSVLEVIETMCDYMDTHDWHDR